jgi:hypothetical protein
VVGGEEAVVVVVVLVAALMVVKVMVALVEVLGVALGQMEATRASEVE